jgi:outer membrane protein assembly factor BamA
MRFTPGLLVLCSAALANAQEPQLCSASRSEVTLGPLSGHRIDSVAVITSSPNLGRRGRAIAKMHVRTRPEIIRRELLFAAGDTVDTLRVAESLRRLRKLQFLEDVHVEAQKCPTPLGELLALTVVTRDAWTTRPDIKPGTSPRIGLTERDLLGTGRTVSLSLVSHNRSLGAGISTLDAFGFGTGVATRAQYQRYYEGTVRSLSFARRQASLADRWRAQLDFWDQHYEPKSATSEQIERTGGDLIAGIRLSPLTASHVVYL